MKRQSLNIYHVLFKFFLSKIPSFTHRLSKTYKKKKRKPKKLLPKFHFISRWDPLSSKPKTTDSHGSSHPKQIIPHIVRILCTESSSKLSKRALSGDHTPITESNVPVTSARFSILPTDYNPRSHTARCFRGGRVRFSHIAYHHFVISKRSISR